MLGLSFDKAYRVVVKKESKLSYSYQKICQLNATVYKYSRNAADMQDVLVARYCVEQYKLHVKNKIV